ncbi:MAG TPA: YoaK family protein, partial [Gemmataceae bacterium]|nr:YoaK family protein [Gemmataceae bacterium]
MVHAEAEKAGIQGWAAMLLAFVGGFVDAVGYLVLFQMFTAHHSGNSIGLGIYLAQGNWVQALHRGFPIPVFIAGVGLGTLLQEWLSRRGVRPTYAFTFAVESLLLGLFMAVGQPLLGSSGIPESPGWRFYLVAMLPALAMGFQNATMHRMELGEVRTTYVSAMLTKLAQEFVRWLFWLRDRWAGRPPRDEKFSVVHMMLTV